MPIWEALRTFPLLEEIAQYPKDKDRSWCVVQTLERACTPRGLSAFVSCSSPCHCNTKQIANQCTSPTFYFPSWVEICRSKQEVEVPADLHDAYFSSLACLPELGNTCVYKTTGILLFSHTYWRAVAVAKGHRQSLKRFLRMGQEGTAEAFLKRHKEK